MRKVSLFLFLLSISISGFAQFSLDNGAADEYLRKKAEQAEARRVQDSIRQAKLEELQMMATDIRFKLKWVNMLTLRQNVGFVENGYNLSYSGFLVSKAKWTYPIGFKISSSSSYNESNLKSGFKDWSEHTTSLGASGFKNLRDNWYLSLGCQPYLGWERYRFDGTDGHELETSDVKRHFHFLVGLGTEERIFYMSPNKVGLVLGFGFYQKLMNSKVYTVDAGFSFDVGLKF